MALEVEMRRHPSGLVYGVRVRARKPAREKVREPEETKARSAPVRKPRAPKAAPASK